jgi:hypothetical protein
MGVYNNSRFARQVQSIGETSDVSCRNGLPLERERAVCYTPDHLVGEERRYEAVATILGGR